MVLPAVVIFGCRVGLIYGAVTALAWAVAGAQRLFPAQASQALQSGPPGDPPGDPPPGGPWQPAGQARLPVVDEGWEYEVYEDDNAPGDGGDPDGAGAGDMQLVDMNRWLQYLQQAAHGAMVLIGFALLLRTRSA